MNFDILNRWTLAVVYRAVDASDFSSAVIAAIASGADLYCADLRGADLGGANLGRANLYGADLGGANLRDADLRDADLRDANLRDADLYGADLRGANLYGADLRDADLGGANLYGADLRSADLRGAYGLLPGGIIPLQILSGRNAITVREAGHITIGCEHHTVEWWEEHYAALGHREGYTDQETLEYRKHIQYCKEWMEAKGVLHTKREAG